MLQAPRTGRQCVRQRKARVRREDRTDVSE